MAILAVINLPQLVFGQTNSITFDRLFYLTPKLDSLRNSFVHQGFIVGHSSSSIRDSIMLPSGQRVYLETSGGSDSSWENAAIAKYGTHVEAVVFRVPSTPKLFLTLDSIGIPHGQLIPHHDRGGIQLGFVVDSTAPLQFVFVSSDSLPRRATDTLPNRFRRISWLVLTAGPEVETTIRRLFDALQLTKLHEGCCDYWLVGPPDNRVAIRFEIPKGWPRPIPNQPVYKGNWLSIEDGGVVYSY